MVFPSLNVTRRPIVEQGDAKDMVFGLGDVHRFALRVALAHKNAQLEFNVQPLTRAQHRFGGTGWHGLSPGPPKLLARHPNAGGAAMVANGHPFVIGQQRVVRAKLFADVGGMVHRSVEVGVVANAGGHRVFGMGLRHQAGLQRV